MTLFECSISSYPGGGGLDSTSWDIWVKSNGAVCNSNLLTPRDWDSCITPVAMWSVGATGQFLPEHIGIPMGTRNGAKYYMLEIHYDNPKAKRGKKNDPVIIERVYLISWYFLQLQIILVFVFITQGIYGKMMLV